MSRFNSRTRKGCDISIKDALDRGFVSIHAPVKGATTPYGRKYLSSVVSIHAPVKGATCKPSVASGSFPVSIHAPVKGATNFPGCVNHRPGFQFTHP